MKAFISQSGRLPPQAGLHVAAAAAVVAAAAAAVAAEAAEGGNHQWERYIYIYLYICYFLDPLTLEVASVTSEVTLMLTRNDYCNYWWSNHVETLFSFLIKG